MTVYCVFQRIQINMFHWEFVLQKVFATSEDADKYVELKSDTNNWCWESHIVE